MQSWWYTWLPLLLIVLVLYLRKKKIKKLAASFMQRKKEIPVMRELAERFIGKDCIINLLEGAVDGVLREVTAGGLVIEKDGKQQAVSLHYVVKIREYPRNKKGRRAVIAGE